MTSNQHQIFADASRFVLSGGARHVHLDSVTSTNEILLHSALNGDDGAIWLTAGQQISGKGRSGRQWVSKPGNLYASLLLMNAAPTEHLSTLSLVAGLAVRDAMASYTGNADFKLKWPNDVLLGANKMCGILLEAQAVPSGMAVVLGCGINCQHHPQASSDMLYPANDLKSLELPHDPQVLFQHLQAAFADRLLQWNRAINTSGIVSDWLDDAHGLGRQIKVRYPHSEETGIFESIDQYGCLILSTTTGKKRISAADVFFF